MKLSILALGAASAGIFAAVPCYAQLQIQAQPMDLQVPQPILVAQSPSSVPDNPFNRGGLGGMFDAAKSAIGLGGDQAIGSGAVQAEISDPAALSEPTSVSMQAPVSTQTQGKSVPSGQPTALTHPHLFTAPHINDMPIEWPSGQRNVLNPYNPTAVFMLHNWCTQGLWDTYPSQRARECARIQQHLSGQCGCGSHHGACGIGCGSGCGGGVVNRYVSGASAGCDSCGAGAAYAPAQDMQYAAPVQAPTVYEAPVQLSPTPAPPQPTAPSAAVGLPSTGSVAARPGDLVPPPAYRPQAPVNETRGPVTAGRTPSFQIR